MSDHAFTMEEAALAAASQATEATAELIRFTREGAYSRNYPLAPDVDVVAKLADALKLTIEIAPPKLDFHDDDERENLSQLQAELTRFLEGWVG